MIQIITITNCGVEGREMPTRFCLSFQKDPKPLLWPSMEPVECGLLLHGIDDVFAWWSDSPYNSWSAPITIATGVKDDDISAITPIPSQGKIGIFWSNQTTRQFGFRTHADGTSPTTWMQMNCRHRFRPPCRSWFLR